MKPVGKAANIRQLLNISIVETPFVVLLINVTFSNYVQLINASVVAVVLGALMFTVINSPHPAKHL